MSIIAKLRYLRIAPRKVRLVADLVRGEAAEKAQTILTFTNKGAANPLLKLLNSAMANARNKQLDTSNLFISKITVDEGPKYKRWMPRARGRAAEIQKKTSHITIVLDEIKGKPKKTKRVKKAPVEPAAVAEKVEKAPKAEKPKFRADLETQKPKTEKGIKRIFRRKAF